MISFANRAEQYIRKLIRIRTRLLKDGSSKKDPKQMEAICSFLTVHLNAWEYSDKTMALFMIRNANHIEQIIPGEDAVNYWSLKNEYDLLQYQAVQILKSNTIKSKPQYIF